MAGYESLAKCVRGELKAEGRREERGEGGRDFENLAKLLREAVSTERASKVQKGAEHALVTA
jgi:hypothetical protein